MILPATRWPTDEPCTKVRAVHPSAPPIKAMLLAAGRGERMRPMTDSRPKPLLQVRGQPLLRWLVDALARGGFTDLVINTAWLGEQIPDYFGAMPQAEGRPLSIHFSQEGLDFGAALETAGGIARVLPDLGEVFWALAADVYVPDFRFEPQAVARFAQSDKLAHLWLVPNPPHNPAGDFGLSEDGLALNQHASQTVPRFTFSTIALYRRELFGPPWSDIAAGNPQGIKAGLAPLLRQAMDNRRVSAELYTGAWADVGTPARLAQLNEMTAS